MYKRIKVAVSVFVWFFHSDWLIILSVFVRQRRERGIETSICCCGSILIPRFDPHPT